MSNLIKIPELPSTGNQALDEALRALAHNIDLLDNGKANIIASKAGALDSSILDTPGGGTGGGTTAAVPTKPSNVAANGGYRINIVTWDQPTFTGYAYTQVWRHKLDDDGASGGDLGEAVLIGSSSAPIFVDRNIESGDGAYYWVRHANNATVTQFGPFHDGTGNGEYAEASLDIDVLLDSLREESQVTNPGQYLFVTEGGDIVIDGAYIKNLSVKNEAVETLVATKLFAASGTIADAIIGAAEITDAMITNIIQSSNYNGVTHVGWRLNKSGTIEAHGIVIYNDSGVAILTSGGIQAAGIPWLGDFALVDYLDGVNISTYIQALAVKNMLVSSAAIDTANIATAAVETLQIAGEAVVANAFANTTTPYSPPSSSYGTHLQATINAGASGVVVDAIVIMYTFRVIVTESGPTDMNAIFDLLFYDSVSGNISEHLDFVKFSRDLEAGESDVVSFTGSVISHLNSPSSGNHTISARLNRDGSEYDFLEGRLVLWGAKR